MKKLLTFAVAMFAAFTLSSCGGTDDPEAAKMLTEFEQMINDYDKMDVDKSNVASLLELAEKAQAIGEKAQAFTAKEKDMSSAQISKFEELAKKFAEISEKKTADMK